jgi:hypothetical protein
MLAAMSRRRSLGTALLIAVLACAVQPVAARGQAQEYHWSAPHRLSSYQEVYTSASHVMAADQYGYVHVFWIEQLLGRRSQVIQYARFDGEHWSQPMDVYVTASSIYFLSVALSARGSLHLAWTEGPNFRQNPIYTMQAPAHEAMSARNWSKPQRVAVSAHLMRLLADAEGTLHLLYTEFFSSRAGVHYVRSSDSGATWSKATWLDPDAPAGMAPYSLEFVLDEAGGLHAGWHYTPIGDTGGDWVRYAQSRDGGQSWSAPFTIDKDVDGSGRLRVADPVLAVQGQAVHMVWAGGVLNYRNHRFSLDGGRTWSAAKQIFGSLNGQAGDSLEFDGEGRLHFAGQIRYPQGIYHAFWSDGRWSGPFLLYLIKQNSNDLIRDRYHAHGLRLAARGGKQLVVLFYDRADEGPHVLYAMHTAWMDESTLDIEPTPAASALASVELPTAASPTALAAPTHAAVAGSLDDGDDPLASMRSSSPGGPIWIGVFVATVSLSAAIGVQLVRRRRELRPR